MWDDRDSENGELREYKLLYFLQDDTIAVKASFFCLFLYIGNWCNLFYRKTSSDIDNTQYGLQRTLS